MVGEINYPNIEINPQQISFGCLPYYTADYREIILKNVSPLTVYYQWKWIEEDFSEEHIEPSLVLRSIYYVCLICDPH